jgi:Zn-dependent oligopeptidase
MTSFKGQYVKDENERPHIQTYVILPAYWNQTIFINFNEVTTLFHEFGMVYTECC